MRYSETGVNLEINLTPGNIEKVETDPKIAELYLAGQGAAAKILWERGILTDNGNPCVKATLAETEKK